MNHAHILYTVITGLYIYLQEPTLFREHFLHSVQTYSGQEVQNQAQTIGICHALAIRSCFV